ncbi:MAG TPA: hypothetical protein VKU01_01270 [Bryobacteraceae bacterium]|nr:hypothetical protein [Bryobacteraceae bacterium]
MPDYILLLILGVVAAALVAVGMRILYQLRRNPLERERRRRLAVNATGRLADGNITETGDNAIFYSYSVGGVLYAASQEITELKPAIPFELERLIGAPVTVKYTTRNPANSIVVCEDWSGLRSRP